MTVRQMAAELYGGGMESAGAETEFWAQVPELPAAELAKIVRQIEPARQYEVMVCAIRHTSKDRLEEIRAQFTPEELESIREASDPLGLRR